MLRPRLEVERSSGGGGGTTFPCYVTGTRLAVPEGAVAVEDLTVGTMVLTAGGETRPVQWIGHRNVNCSQAKDPAAVWPICIQAGAFADGQPSRDLWVSPAHCILVSSALIPAEKLVNGATIVQMPRESVHYWHVELDRHDVLLAEGLAAESYLDTGNRTNFINGGEFLDAHPDFKPRHSADTCVPLVLEGPEIERAKSALLARAQSLGYETTSDADVHILADGQRIDAASLSNHRLAFMLPPGAANIELRSRTFVPAQMEPASDDRRVMGICVSRLQLDGADVSLDDAGVFADAWHPLERAASGAQWRWSHDRAALPAGTRLVVIDLNAHGVYWRSRPHLADVPTAAASA